ncbi:hypothetical protein [Oceanobacter kriegii]|uniref:hypothetical protein n=1 Tax=Oceanobacter kriegii TaxID=64972 RepID=UPI0004114787|nr:hypothetical protein [Oceanobacter kriegii]
MYESKAELENKIANLEARLVDLKDRLARIEQTEQHDAVEHVDEYMEVLDREFASLREYWPVALQELQKLFKK